MPVTHFGQNGLERIAFDQKPEVKPVNKPVAQSVTQSVFDLSKAEGEAALRILDLED